MLRSTWTLRFFASCMAFMLLCNNARPSRLFIPMDAGGQDNHLKAYGVVFAALQQGIPVSWLLNYRGGSFVVDDNSDIRKMCNERGVSCFKINDKAYAGVEKEMADGGNTYNIVKLEKVPKIAVYTPGTKKPWDDAVTLALTYAEIPFDKIYANEVLSGALAKYDWLHLHHEDFTGQLGKYWGQFGNTDWYQDEQNIQQGIAEKNGFKKIQQMQLAVVKKIRAFVANGGNLFAMCSATETFDVALAAENVDICESPFDGDPVDNNFQQKLDYSKCLAFTNFTVYPEPMRYEHSSIDNFFAHMVPEYADTFILSTFPAQPDPVPAMLTQNHTTFIKGFMGQTTVFRKDKIKPGVLILAGYPPPQEIGEDPDRPVNIYNMHNNEARYIHGDLEKGTWTFYSGHDPEDFQHMVNDAPTDLSEHPNSPGYRLILNNVLLHAAKRVVIPKVACCDIPLTIPAPEPKPATTPLTISGAESYNLYPTASNDQLIITVNHSADEGPEKRNTKIERVVITNMDGKELINKTVSGESVNVDIKDLAPGMYMVTVNGTYSGKLMKE